LEEQFKELVEKTPLDWMLLGSVVQKQDFSIDYNGRELLRCDLTLAKDIWKNTLKDMF